MRTASSIILSLALSLNSIDLSSETSNPRPDVPRSKISLRRAFSPSRSSPPHSETFIRIRSKSPPGSASSSFLLGYTNENYKSIRLIPHSNPSRRFEIRKYKFPPNKFIHLRGEQNALEPIPTEEQTILSTSDGEVFAIVHEYRRLRGIYTTISGVQKRAKINIYSGVVQEMTKEEIRESPLGRNVSISKSFEILRTETESRSHSPSTGPDDTRHDISHSAAESQSRASPSSSYLPGYTLEQLKFIRLIPYINPSRRFEIRNYTFPRDKPIQMRQDHHVFLPIPPEEQTVLSTPDGEILAIVVKNKSLRGLYTTATFIPKRAKLNMFSGAVEEMTTGEIRETPLGKNAAISKNFEIIHIKRDSPSSAKYHDPGSSSSSSAHSEPLLRARSTSPPASPAAFYFLKYTLEQLKYIRLIPDTNPSRRFEVRRYAFPRDKLIQVRGEYQVLMPVPIEEQTVISTSDGDVFAIVSDNRRLRGIYTNESGPGRRVKINIYSGALREMTAEETRETPCGRRELISNSFGIININEELSSQTGMSHPPDHDAPRYL